jgi:hypothetical protein
MPSNDGAQTGHDVEGTRKQPRRRLLARATALSAALAVIGFSSVAGAEDKASVAATPAEAGGTVAEYRTRTRKICTSAHARLNKVVRAAGVELTAIRPGRLDLAPTSGDGLAAYEKAARRIMARTLPKLRSVPPPQTVRARFDHMYGLMVQYSKGQEAPFTPTADFWIHQVEQEPSLYPCTFSLPR